MSKAAARQAAFDAEWEQADDSHMTADTEAAELKRQQAQQEQQAVEDLDIDTIEGDIGNTAPPPQGSANKKKSASVTNSNNSKDKGFADGFQEIPLLGGGLYKGYVQNNAFHGEGTLTFSNGDRYVGAFSKDLRHGRGCYTVADAPQTAQLVAYVAGEDSSKMQQKTNVLAGIGGGNSTSQNKGAGTTTTGGGGPSSPGGAFTLVRYDGDWHEDARHGFGTALFSNGDTYTGPFAANRPDTTETTKSGAGTTAATGTSSSISDGSPAVEGAFDTATVDSNAIEGTREAVVFVGRYRYADGRVYRGQLVAGRREGFGCLRHANGDIHIGTFSRGVLHGDNCTMLLLSSSSSSTGAGGKARHAPPPEPPAGVAEALALNGSLSARAAAEHALRSIHGNSSSSNSTGKVYHGVVHMGRRVCGALTHPDGKMYDGEWLQVMGTGGGAAVQGDKPHGAGICTMRNRDVYTGEWFNGRMHGRGRMVYADPATGAASGKVFDGFFVADRAHGWGTTLLPSGVMIHCLWDNGKQVPPEEYAEPAPKSALLVLLRSASLKAAKQAKAAIVKEAHEQQTKVMGRAAVGALAGGPDAMVILPATVDPESALDAAFDPDGTYQRRTGCTVNDLPSLDWFDSISSASCTSASGGTVSHTNKSAAHGGPPIRRAARAGRATGAGGTATDDDDDSDEEEIDIDALEEAVVKGNDDSSAAEATHRHSDPSTSSAANTANGQLFREAEGEDFWEFHDEVAEDGAGAYEEVTAPGEDDHHNLLERLRRDGLLAAMAAGGGDGAAANTTVGSNNTKENTKKTPLQAPPAADKPDLTGAEDDDDDSGGGGGGLIGDNNLANDGCVTVHRGMLFKYSVGKSFFTFGGGWKYRFFCLIRVRSQEAAAKIFGPSKPQGGSSNNASASESSTQRGPPYHKPKQMGLLLYYEDSGCERHLGTVALSSPDANAVLHRSPSERDHKKVGSVIKEQQALRQGGGKGKGDASEGNLDLVIEYSENGKPYKLLLRANTRMEKDAWVMYLSKMIPHVI